MKRYNQICTNDNAFVLLLEHQTTRYHRSQCVIWSDTRTIRRTFAQFIEYTFNKKRTIHIYPHSTLSHLSLRHTLSRILNDI